MSFKGDDLQEKNNNKTLHNIILRDKFLDLSKTLEEELQSVVEMRMKKWREENLMAETTNYLLLSNSSKDSLSASKNSPKRKQKNETIPSRVFMERPSLLNELLTISHFQSVYNLFGAILFILFLQQGMEEMVKTGRIDLRLSYISWSFGKFDRALVIWLYMMTSTLVGIYLCFYLWAHQRHKAPSVFDGIGALLFLSYLFFFLHLPVQSLLRNQLHPASSIALLSEQVRLFMKTYAFVRTNVTRALNYKKDDTKVSKSPCPEFSQYLYFLFVPTLVYRDEYPRSASCSWGKVMKEFAQVVGCLLYIHFLLTRFCGPVFERFGREEFSASTLTMAVFSCCFPASIVLLCGFFMVLHAWMNAFAEMLRFGDRMFYRDWWNSTSYPRFYRTWNCIVHDWLYEYVYKELSDWQARCKGMFPRLKCLPMLVVFFISSVVHEFILAFSFRFFYPVLLVMFGGFGVLFMFINTKASLFNMFIWVSLILGPGIIMCLYCLEWYARINCPPAVDGFWDYVVPRSWFCFS